MSHWLVTQGNNQFSVEGLGELKQLARAGDLRPGDMIQPPGATDWIYAVEIPELKEVLPEGKGEEEDDIDWKPRRGLVAAVGSAAIAAILLGVIAVGGGIMFVMFQQLPTGDESLIGDGGLAYSEMLVTGEGISLLSGPEANARALRALEKNQVLDLLAKRGDFYRAATKDGAEGWVAHDQVLPIYQLGGAEVREEFDPLYNPDRYVEVVNASWQQLPDQTAERITVFQFMMRNTSDYPMTDLVIRATIKDARGHELEKVEIPIEGIIPARGATMVGTLEPEAKAPDAQPRLLTQYTFDRLARTDPDLQLRYSAGVEAQMNAESFTNAQIDIVELRAVPDEVAADAVSRN